MGVIQGLRYFFGYDAVSDKSRRRSPAYTIRREDDELSSYDRRKLVATARDLPRNFAVAKWAIDKHLDYVSRFHFVAQTGVEVVDDALERAWADWSQSADICGRHTLQRMMRIFEACKVLDGDAAILKVRGGKLQGIEGNRIAKPTWASDKAPQNINDQGLVVDDFGKVLQYCVCDRDASGLLKFGSMIDARDIVFDGYFSRFDQLRGISPLASALNTFKDLLEAFEYQLIKAKMHAMFGVAIYSDATSSNGSGFLEQDADTGETADSSTTKYQFEIQPGLKLELDKGDKIETIESRTPSAEFVGYTELMMRLSLLALDIPYTFLDTTKANFSGRKMDMVEYELASRHKREANRAALMNIADWKIPQLAMSGAHLNAAMKNNGLTLSDLRYDFRAEGTPWIDEAAEVDAAVKRISSGLSSWSRETKRRGESFKDIAEELAYEQDLLARLGVTVTTGQPGAPDNNADLEEYAPTWQAVWPEGVEAKVEDWTR